MNSEYNTKKFELNKNKVKFDISSITILLLTVMLFIILSVTTETFFSYSNIYTMLYSVSFKLFAAIGFTFLMIMGEVDLSVGAVYAFSGTFLGAMVTLYGVPFWPALIVALIVSSAFGFINGFLVTKFKLDSLIITIGMMTLVRGLFSLLLEGLQGYIFPAEYRALVKYRIFGIHWTIYLAVIAIIVLEVLLYKTSVFKKMYYVGQNIKSAVIYGIKSNKIKIITFTLSSFTAAVGGILAASRITNANIKTGQNLEFTIITAAVLGGASLFGGKGSILRTALGLFFLTMVSTGMVIFKIQPLIQQSIVGAMLIIAVIIDLQLNKNREAI